MSNEKKERVMTPKGFLHKTTTKAAASASAFLSQYREWLSTGEVAIVTAPILAKLDAKELMPTPALSEIINAVYTHMVVSEIRKGEEAMARREAGPQSTPKNWIVTVYDSRGNIATRVNAKGETEELTKSFDKGQDADRWADRRLVEGEPDCIAVVQHATILNRHGEPLSQTILRGDAMARTFAASKGPVMRKTGGTTSSLSFRPKAHNDVSKFSHG
jgi:hypothetical protein